ncbi:LOW QUALITY PROTEIN: hypothetical protein NC652_023709 [Populus alba x Populus x berolinensis]|nr:LOW QUALITY PROTEIN: hypothetical protein NC652_023709 [Populus alba x Populus x berolinensis]
MKQKTRITTQVCLLLPFFLVSSLLQMADSVMECSSPTGPRELQQSGMLVNVFNWELQEVESEFPGSWYHQFFPSLTGRPTVLQLLHNEDRLFLSFLGFESDISMNPDEDVCEMV